LIPHPSPKFLFCRLPGCIFSPAARVLFHAVRPPFTPLVACRSPPFFAGQLFCFLASSRVSRLVPRPSIPGFNKGIDVFLCPALPLPSPGCFSLSPYFFDALQDLSVQTIRSVGFSFWARSPHPPRRPLPLYFPFSSAMAFTIAFPPRCLNSWSLFPILASQ